MASTGTIKDIDGNVFYPETIAECVTTSDNKVLEQVIGEKIDDAKKDGRVYARKNGAWVEMSDGQGPQGPAGPAGPAGPQGNSGYSGAADELEVVNNLTQGGATAALSAEMGKELKEKAVALDAKIEGDFVDVTSRYNVNNGCIFALRNIAVGETFNGNYGAQEGGGYRHIIADVTPGDEFYYCARTYNAYRSIVFLDTETNIVIGIRISSFSTPQKCVVPEGANQMVMIGRTASGEKFGIFEKPAKEVNDVRIYSCRENFGSAYGGWVKLREKGTTTDVSYYNGQAVDVFATSNSGAKYYIENVEEGEKFYAECNPISNAPFAYCILDEDDKIVYVHPSRSYTGDIVIPKGGKKLVVNCSYSQRWGNHGVVDRDILQKYKEAKVGREITYLVGKGRIGTIHNGNVGDILPNLTYQTYSYSASLLAECKEGERVVSNIGNNSSNDYTIAFIGENNELLFRVIDTSTKILSAVAPEGTKYVYISYFTSSLNDSALSSVKIFIDKSEDRFDAIESKLTNEEFVVPSTFRCVVGQQKVIYYDNLIKGIDSGLSSPSAMACSLRIDDFGEKDMNYDRCWSMPASQMTTSRVGTHILDFRAYDYKLRSYAMARASIKVIPKNGLISAHNIVIIGDSNIDGSPILKTIYDRFVWLGGVQPTFVGSKTATFDGVSINHEGKSGTTVGQWTNSLSSFWNSSTGKLDVANYRSKYSIDGLIDVAVIALGINDCILQSGPGAGAIQPLVDALLEDNPNCKVILELPHLGANTMGGGWMVYPYSAKKITYYNNVMAQRKSYINFYENSEDYKDKVIIGDGCYCLDRYYGFPNSTKKMSDIIDVQEFVHTNCVHPNSFGYQQEGQEYFVAILDMLQTIENG